MARQRTIAPGFFANEDLAALPPLTRIFFQGLWCWADREGRVEDRPRKLKALILPFDDTDGEQAMTDLAAAGFVERYEVDGVRVARVVNFEKHQSPHPREIASVLPEAPPSRGKVVPEPDPSITKDTPSNPFPSSSSSSSLPSFPSSPSHSMEGEARSAGRLDRLEVLAGGRIPTQDEGRTAQFPKIAALRERLSGRWPGLHWLKTRQAHEAMEGDLAALPLEVAATACERHVAAWSTPPGSMSAFAPLIADLAKNPASAAKVGVAPKPTRGMATPDTDWTSEAATKL